MKYVTKSALLAVFVAALALLSGPTVADVFTHVEYRAYCTGPAWSGPWVSYEWNAEVYLQDRMKHFDHRYCGIAQRSY